MSKIAGIIFLFAMVGTAIQSAVAGSWDYLILDPDPPVDNLGSQSIGDVDGDGRYEIISGGSGGLVWNRPATFARGIISTGTYQVGSTLSDLDKDGLLEVVVAENNPSTKTWGITWFKPDKDLAKPWKRYVLDPQTLAGAHDLVFADLDQDGQDELIANNTYGAVWGVFAYKRPADITQPWTKYEIHTGFAEEALAVADLDNDGKPEIISGPSIYTRPAAGPFSGTWQRTNYALNFREMVRLAPVDVNADGRLDIVIAESEYPDGLLSWFENKGANTWLEHRIDQGWNFAHSLTARTDAKTGKICIFIAEMMKGGWDAPYNYDARLAEFISHDQGASWQNEILYRGAGTHQAVEFDIDKDGQYEVVGHIWGAKLKEPKIQIFKKQAMSSPLTQVRHTLLDKDKPYTGTDIIATDVDGDGKQDVVCGAWWYKNGLWERYTIPGMYQIHLAYDLDGDHRDELIGTKEFPSGKPDWYGKNSGELCWLKAVDPKNGKWEIHQFGRSPNGWPHGVGIGPVLPGGQLAFFATYHGGGYPLFTLDKMLKSDIENGVLTAAVRTAFANNTFPLSASAVLSQDEEKKWEITDKANQYLYLLWPNGDVLEVRGGYPEIFEIPRDPKKVPWPKRVLAEIKYGEEFITHDLDKDGKLDIMAGWYWLAGRGDGTFEPVQIMDPALRFQSARFRLMDVNRDGLQDILAVEEDLSYVVHEAYFARVAWFENPGGLRKGYWKMHLIDKMRSPHSLDVADFDKDGHLEFVCAEHDPFKPYRSRCRTFIYKQANDKADGWYRCQIDGRFEQHDGTKVIELAPGKLGIMSHGWKDSRYVSLWELW